MRDVDDASSSGGDSSADSKSDDGAPEALPIRTETAASAAAAAAAKSAIPPAAKKADPNKHCKYYSTGGVCGKKGRCRFVHDPAVREAALRERERNGGRMTLQQRLTLNDKDQEDLTIIKTLHYLKEKGMMKEQTSPAEAAAPTSSANHSASSSSATAMATSPGDAKGAAPDLPSAPSQAAAERKQPRPQQQQQQAPPPPPPPPSVLDTMSGASGESAAGAVTAPTVRYQGWDLSGFGNRGVKAEDD